MCSEDKHFYDYIASEVKKPIKYTKQRKNERDINRLPTDVISKINEIVNDLFLFPGESECGGEIVPSLIPSFLSKILDGCASPSIDQ